MVLKYAWWVKWNDSYESTHQASLVKKTSWPPIAYTLHDKVRGIWILSTLGACCHADGIHSCGTCQWTGWQSCAGRWRNAWSPFPGSQHAEMKSETRSQHLWQIFEVMSYPIVEHGSIWVVCDPAKHLVLGLCPHVRAVRVHWGGSVDGVVVCAPVGFIVTPDHDPFNHQTYVQCSDPSFFFTFSSNIPTSKYKRVREWASEWAGGQGAVSDVIVTYFVKDPLMTPPPPPMLT